MKHKLPTVSKYVWVVSVCRRGDQSSAVPIFVGRSARAAHAVANEYSEVWEAVTVRYEVAPGQLDARFPVAEGDS